MKCPHWKKTGPLNEWACTVPEDEMIDELQCENEALKAELAAYKEGVEVGREVRPAGNCGNRYGMVYVQLNKEWIGQRVRVLVMRQNIDGRTDNGHK